MPLAKVDDTVRRETAYIAGFVLVGSVLMEAVFLIIRRWDYTVLLGNLLSGGAAVLNFFLMGRTVQSAVTKEKKDAENLMKLSQMLRYLMLIAVVAAAYLIKCFNLIAVVIPLLFPRIAISLRPLFDKKNRNREGEQIEKD